MKFNIEKTNFFKVLSKTQSVADKKLSMAILSNVLLETINGSLSIKATNLEVGINILCTADIIEEGKIAISSKALFDIVKELPDENISVSVSENFVTEISCGDIQFKIMGVDWQEFPKIMNYDSSNFSIIPISFLKEMIEKTLFAVSHDETRPFLNGAFLEYKNIDNDDYLRMVTTDGRRLSLVDSKFKLPNNIDLSKGIIIPYKGLLEILKNFPDSSGTCEIALEKNFLVLKENNTLLYMRLIDGNYPNYTRAIPVDLPIKIFIDRNILLSSLKRVSLVSDEKTKSIRFALNGKKMKIYTDTSNLGDAKEDISIECDSISNVDISFNSTLVIELLSVIDQDKVIMELKDESSAGIIRPINTNNNLYVVMPLRTQ